MATSKKLKALVRAEQARSGDSYMTVLARLRQQRKGAVVTNKPTAQRLLTDSKIFRKTKAIRVWRSESGTPVALGILRKTASEEDFIRTFFAAMPGPGDGVSVFLLRPYDRTGNELGVELPLLIQSDHPLLDQLRKTVVNTFFGDEPPQDTVITPALLNRVFGGEKPKRSKITKAQLEERLALRDAELAQLDKKVRVLSVTADNQDKRIQELTRKGLPDPWADMRGTAENPNNSPPTQFMLYSTAYFPAGAVISYLNERIFTTALGSTLMTKGAPFDKSDTNLKEGGRVPGGMSVQVRSVTVEIIGGTEEDARQLRDTSVLTWDVTQTMLDIGPIGTFEWDTAGRKGVFKLTDMDVTPDDRSALLNSVGEKVETIHALAQSIGAPHRPGSSALPARRPSNLFKWGPEGFIIPGDTTFAMLVQHGRCDREISKTTRLRVSLACTRLDPIEIG